MLRFVAGAAGVDLEKTCRLAIAQRQGQKSWQPGEHVRLRLGLDPDSALEAAVLLRTMHTNKTGKGEFRNGVTLQLSGLETPMQTGNTPEANLAAFLENSLPLPVCNLENFAKEFVRFLSIADRPWHLEFLTPARLPLPEGQKKEFPFAMPNFFATHPLALDCLVSRLRSLPPDIAQQQQPSTEGLRITGLDLRWEDMAYNEDRKIQLGGIIGHIAMQGRPAPETAMALVAGQYLGAGKNPRFGMGMYRIPELEGARLMPVYPEARHSFSALP